MDEIYDSPSDIRARKGGVSVKGPDGVDVTLTPEAALETADRLVEGAAEAHGDDLLDAERAQRHGGAKD